MKIVSGENFIEFEVTLDEEESLPIYGDAYILVSISSHGYCGKNDLWVSKDDLSQFFNDIIKLEESRQGSALLSSISPGELEINVYSTDSRGHMAVKGCTGYSISSGESTFKHSVEFGFGFEPDQLVRLSKQIMSLKNG